MLTIDNLHAAVEEHPILKGLSITFESGKVHAIMGPNGAGKSTLAKILAGDEAYDINDGSVSWQGEDLLEEDIEARSHAGIFIGFQYPVEVPGVNNSEFLRLASNAGRKARGQDELTAEAFAPILAKCMQQTGVDPSWSERDLNAGFSGGQKKRNEILQMFVLQPQLAVLDETDSGLDIDALRIVAEGINTYHQEHPDATIVLITHYQRLLDLVSPDHVHVLMDGQIAESGGPELALKLEEAGYDWLSK
jgi:Fe-S cluster assembly ATP-binding protein